MDSVPHAPAGRVAEHTAVGVQHDLEAETLARVTDCAADPALIPERLRALDAEWDIERALETNASSLILVGLGLGVAVDRRWLALPAAVAGFLWQHGVQGWCPPLPVLRRLGFRTRRELDWERTALKALRGDFGDLGGGTARQRAQAALRAAGSLQT